MGETDWKDNLSKFIDDLRVIDRSICETIEDFDQFCEFIAEPAFESLAEELRKYKIKSKFKTKKGKSIGLSMNFPRSKIDNFQYVIILHKDSLNLRLKLQIRGRKDKNNLMEESEEQFMDKLSSSDILKLSKEDLIQDVIEHFKNFKFGAFTWPS